MPYGVGTDQIANGKLRTQLFKISHNYTFNGTTTNEFGFGVNHNYTRAGAGDSTLPRFDLTFVDFRINPIGPAQFDQERTGVVYRIFSIRLRTFAAIIRLRPASISGLTAARLIRRTQDTLTFFGMNDLQDQCAVYYCQRG